MSTFQFFTSGFDSKLTVAVSEKYLQMMEKKPLISFGRTLIQQFQWLVNKNIKIKSLNSLNIYKFSILDVGWLLM